LYLLNRLSTKALTGKNTLEAWFEVKLSVAHLKVFGSVCYIYVPKTKKDKLEQRAVTGMFLGYSNNNKAYGVFDFQVKKVVIARDVKFDGWHLELDQRNG